MTFGLHIAAQLERLAAERPLTARTAVPSRSARTTAAAVVEEEPLELQEEADAQEFYEDEAVAADETLDDTTEEQEIQLETPQTSVRSSTDWTDILMAMRRDIEMSQSMMAAPALAPAIPEVTIEIPVSLSADVPAESRVRQESSGSVSSENAAAASFPRKRKKRRSPPQDEWGFYDPQRCGVSALIAKVNENNDGTRKKPV